MISSLEHNAGLAASFVASSGIHSRFPRVTDQCQTLNLDTSKFCPFGYNPSLIHYRGKILISYRYHVDSLSSRLALAEISTDGQVMWNRPLFIPAKSAEDPKLFHHRGALWMSWVESDWDGSQTYPKCVVKFGQLVHDRPHETLCVEFGKNDWSAMEKNWVFFDTLNRLFSIYSCSPDQVVLEVAPRIMNLGEPIEPAPRTEPVGIVEQFKTPGPTWPYGEIRGGTPPIEWNGKLLRFFHSSQRNEFVGTPWRYFLGALLMDPDPPFRTVAVSHKPIVYGSEIDNIKVKARPRHWKDKVVFPGGAIILNADGEILVSIGVNDSACCILRLKEGELNL